MLTFFRHFYERKTYKCIFLVHRTTWCFIVHPHALHHCDVDCNSGGLCAFLFSSETVSALLDHMLNGEKLESVVVNGVSILQTLLECRKVR